MTSRVLLVLSALLVFAAPAVAQTGSVTDETDAVVPGATVQLTGPSVEKVQFTNTAGEFRFQNVPPGTYQLSVTLSGFTDVTLDQVVVADEEVSVSPIQLTIAGIGETVVVSASRAESVGAAPPPPLTRSRAAYFTSPMTSAASGHRSVGHSCLSGLSLTSCQLPVLLRTHLTWTDLNRYHVGQSARA